MKIAILAGGLPSSIAEENERIPKPMVRIGERPILWHIMKLFSYYGYNDFTICAGYRSELIKEYFMDYYVYSSDITVHLQTNEVEIHSRVTEPWEVTVVNTGLRASTAERLQQIADRMEDDFIIVYGDCISNVDIPRFVQSHNQSGKDLTVVLARPTGRNTIVPTDFDGNIIAKDAADAQAWVNACMMMASPDIFKEKPMSGEVFETEVLQRLGKEGRVHAYRHTGFWLPVETVRDRDVLQGFWDKKEVPWKVWRD